MGTAPGVGRGRDLGRLRPGTRGLGGRHRLGVCRAVEVSPGGRAVPPEEHEMPSREAKGLVPALAGAVTSVACAQVPEVSVAAIAWAFPELSV